MSPESEGIRTAFISYRTRRGGCGHGCFGRATRDGKRRVLSIRRPEEALPTRSGNAPRSAAYRAGRHRPPDRLHEPERRVVVDRRRSVTEQRTVPNLVRLFEAAKQEESPS